MSEDVSAATCVICGSAALTPWGRVSDYEYGVEGVWDYVRCRGCGGIQMQPMPDELDLPDFYPSTYGAYKAGSALLSGLISRYVAGEVSHLLSLLPEGAKRVLDIGCGNGMVLEAISRQAPLELWGVEINSAAAAAAKAKGFHVNCGTLKDAGLPEGEFDLIRLGHVLEHFPSPRTEVRQIWKLLKPGGVILGETPNTGSLDFKLFGRYWGAMHAPRHLVLFNRNNLAACLGGAGFDGIHIRPCIPPVGWCVGVQNLIRDKLGLKAPTTGRYPWYPLLLLPFAGLSFMQSLGRDTGIISFQARKPVG